MHAAFSLVAVASCLLQPTHALAQTSESGAFGRPAWNLSAHGGVTKHGEFLLQRPAVTQSDAERSLSTDLGYDFGGALGVDLMPRLGVRASYTFARSEFQYRDDTGDGSTDLDQDNLDELRSHFFAIEVLTYVLRSNAPFTPYGGAGFVGGWHVVQESSEHIQWQADRSLFRTGAIGTLGLQARLGGGLRVRVEAVSSTVKSPFRGRRSFHATGGTTLHEPRRVSKTDYRIAFVYDVRGPGTRTASSDQY